MPLSVDNFLSSFLPSGIPYNLYTIGDIAVKHKEIGKGTVTPNKYRGQKQRLYFRGSQK